MKTTFLISICLTGLILLSFSSNKKPSLKTAMKALNEFCGYIPSGNSVIEGDTLSVQGFYMSSTEITNAQYQEFLLDLRLKGENEKYEIAKVDSLGWNTKYGQNAKYSDYYHIHPAYAQYPVVNITKAGAEMFCEWLTEEYNQLSNGELKLKFRIPTRAEWIRAARGDNHNRVYTWKGVSLLKKDGKSVFHGQIQANFIRNGAECITRNEETGKLEFTFADYSSENYENSGADVMAPVISYWPNEFGMYHMNGNVAEMISEGNFAVGGGWNSPGYDIRNESIKKFEEANYTVGFRVVATYIEPLKK